MLIALLLGAFAPSLLASGPHDHDQARQALEAGEVLPLRKVLERIEREYPGEVLEVEMERKEGRWIYEVKMIHSGQVSKLKLDARDASLIEIRSKNLRHKEERR